MAGDLVPGAYTLRLTVDGKSVSVLSSIKR
jgi:hypothetical protein